MSNRIKDIYNNIISQYDQQIKLVSDNLSKSNLEDQVKGLINNVNNNIINLFLYKNHFSYISRFSALFSKQFDSHNNINRNLYCHYCLYHTKSIEKLITHLKYSLSLDKHAQVKLPSQQK